LSTKGFKSRADLGRNDEFALGKHSRSLAAWPLQERSADGLVSRPCPRVPVSRANFARTGLCALRFLLFYSMLSLATCLHYKLSFEVVQAGFQSGGILVRMEGALDSRGQHGELFLGASAGLFEVRHF